jgi:hypothetical protein
MLIQYEIRERNEWVFQLSLISIQIREAKLYQIVTKPFIIQQNSYIFIIKQF